MALGASRSAGAASLSSVMSRLSGLSAERLSTFLRPAIKRDRFSAQHALHIAGDLRHPPFPNRAVNRKMRRNHFLQIAVRDHPLANYFLADRFETHRLTDHRADLPSHLRVAQRLRPSNWQRLSVILPRRRSFGRDTRDVVCMNERNLAVAGGRTHDPAGLVRRRPKERVTHEARRMHES